MAATNIHGTIYQQTKESYLNDNQCLMAANQCTFSGAKRERERNTLVCVCHASVACLDETSEEFEEGVDLPGAVTPSDSQIPPVV